MGNWREEKAAKSERAVAQRAKYDPIRKRIAELWPTGMSASAIGRELGITKNMVVGHVARMKLPRRILPIMRSGGEPKPKQPPHLRKRRLKDTLAPVVAAVAHPLPPASPYGIGWRVVSVRPLGFSGIWRAEAFYAPPDLRAGAALLPEYSHFANGRTRDEAERAVLAICAADEKFPGLLRTAA